MRYLIFCRPVVKYVCLTVIALTASACTPSVATRGNLVEAYQLAQITPGISTRSDVLQQLGSPTTKAPFNENVWYYMGQIKEKRGIFDPDVRTESILEVAFNEEGVVQSVTPVDNQRQNVPLSDRRTPTAGTELTVLEQLLGNLGKFNTPTDKGSPGSI